MQARVEVSCLHPRKSSGSGFRASLQVGGKNLGLEDAVSGRLWDCNVLYKS